MILVVINRQRDIFARIHIAWHGTGYLCDRTLCFWQVKDVVIRNTIDRYRRLNVGINGNRFTIRYRHYVAMIVVAGHAGGNNRVVT